MTLRVGSLPSPLVAQMCRRTPEAVSEEDFTRWVIRYATDRGWLVHHARPARTARGWRTPVQGHPGAPDILAVRSGVVLLAELKSEQGRLSKEQRRWDAELRSANTRAATTGGLERVLLYRVWRPSDIREIELVLT